MVELLLFGHTCLLWLLYRRLQLLVGRIIALVVLVYMFAFTVLKPAMIYYFGLYLPFSTNEQSAVVAMLWGSLIFLVVQLFAVVLFGGSRPPRIVAKCFDFSRAKPVGIWFTFVLLMAVSFIGSILRFDDVGYLWSSASTFDATMNQANGSYYINYLAEALFYGAIIVLAFYSSRLRFIQSLFFMIFVLGLTYFWAKLAARSGVLVVMIAWLSCSMTLARQRSLNIAYIGAFGYVLLIFLYVGNLVRLGDTASIDLSTAAFGAAMAASSDLSPDDTSVLLYSAMDEHESTNFVQLAGAITPLVLVPSSIFPLKIPADKDSELTRMFFPEGADPTFFHEGSTLTFTVPGSGFADAGYAGVLVASVVYAAILCIFVCIVNRGNSSERFIASVFLLIHVVGYRLSVEALLMTFYSTLLFIGIARWVTVSLSAISSESRPSVAATI